MRSLQIVNFFWEYVEGAKVWFYIFCARFGKAKIMLSLKPFNKWKNSFQNIW